MTRLVTVAFAIIAALPLLADDGPTPVPFSCRTWFYEGVKDLLIPGDCVYGMAIRGMPPGVRPTPGTRAEFVWDAKRFETVLEELADIDLEGIEKTIVFSSYEDLAREIASIPEDIAAVAYNSEGGMTPTGELQNLATYVPKFAALAHEHDLRMNWGPTHHMLARWPDLFELAKHVDGFGLQHQRPLQNEGLEAFTQLTRERYAKIKSINKDCTVTVQVVLERTPAPQAIEAFQAVADCVDRIGIWTMRDKDGLREVLEGLKDLRQDRL